MSTTNTSQAGERTRDIDTSEHNIETHCEKCGAEISPLNTQKESEDGSRVCPGCFKKEKKSLERKHQFGTPRVCTIETETLSDNSKVFNVVFIPETIYCRDQAAAEKLNNAIRAATQAAI